MLDESVRFCESIDEEGWENCTMLVDRLPVFGGQRATLVDGGGNVSGEYRRLGLKFQMITTLSGILIHLSPPHNALEHDSTVFNRTELRDESWELILRDRAYTPLLDTAEESIHCEAESSGLRSILSAAPQVSRTSGALFCPPASAPVL